MTGGAATKFGLSMARASDLTTGLARARSLGFGWVALSARQVGAFRDEGGAARLQASLEAHGLGLLAVAPLAPVTFRMPRDFRALLEETDALCALMAVIECEQLAIFGGVRPYVAEAVVDQEALEVIERLAEIARAYGVRLALGCGSGPRPAIATPAQATRIVTAFDAPDVGLSLDEEEAAAMGDPARLFLLRARTLSPRAPEGWTGPVLVEVPAAEG
jgi:sugar phosphate isomerase/epimerase